MSVFDATKRRVAEARDAARRREAAIEALDYALEQCRVHGVPVAVVTDGSDAYTVRIDFGELDDVMCVAEFSGTVQDVRWQIKERHAEVKRARGSSD